MVPWMSTGQYGGQQTNEILMNFFRKDFKKLFGESLEPTAQLMQFQLERASVSMDEQFPNHMNRVEVCEQPPTKKIIPYSKTSDPLFRKSSSWVVSASHPPCRTISTIGFSKTW